MPTKQIRVSSNLYNQAEQLSKERGLNLSAAFELLFERQNAAPQQFAPTQNQLRSEDQPVNESTPNTTQAQSQAPSHAFDYDTLAQRTAAAFADELDAREARKQERDARARAEEIEQTGRTQILERMDDQEVLLRGLAGSHISHLSQHAALEAGEIDRFDPAASLRPFLDVMPKDQYDAAIAGLPASFRESLESKPALPAPKAVSDDRTIEVAEKPKRNFWGNSR